MLQSCFVALQTVSRQTPEILLERLSFIFPHVNTTAFNWVLNRGHLTPPADIENNTVGQIFNLQTNLDFKVGLLP